MSTISIVSVAGLATPSLVGRIVHHLDDPSSYHVYRTASEGFPLTIVSDAPLTATAYDVYAEIFEQVPHDEVIESHGSGADAYVALDPIEFDIEGATYRFLAEYAGYDDEGERIEF